MVVKSCAQSLYETQKLHMISWWGDLTLMDNFQTPLGELPENLWKLSAHGKSPYKETMQFSHTLYSKWLQKYFTSTTRSQLVEYSICNETNMYNIRFSNSTRASHKFP